MNKILEIVHDIKRDITDNQYKTIMELLIEINNTSNINNLPLLSENYQRNKFTCLFNWLDTKLIITDSHYDCIKKTSLQRYIILDYFDNKYYENIDFVKQILKIYFTFTTKKQFDKLKYQYVKFRDAIIEDD